MRALNWNRIEVVLGETLREVGILILVFAPLESVFSDRPVGEAGMALIFVLAIGLVIVGTLVEAREREER